MPFRKRKATPSPAGAACVPQTASPQPFGELMRYSPLFPAEGRLYEKLREAVPLIDAAIVKLIRLTGGFTVACADKKVQKILDAFLSNVPVGGCQKGMEAFLNTYFDQLLTFGTAVGEMVPLGGGQMALYNAPLDALELRRGKSALQTVVCRRGPGALATPAPHPERILLSVLNPRAGQLGGNSLLQGLPFISKILLQIYQTIGLNWERVGNVRFAVTYKPHNDAMDRAFAKERALQVAKEWGEAMNSGGRIKDFVAVGDVDIRVIGADNQILDSEVPVRQMLEQIVAKTGLPPFLLGLHWSSTERMSSQQADVLTSELESYRRILTPVIETVCRTFLRLNGHLSGCQVIWDDITLQDEVELGRAHLYHAQAAELESRQKSGKEHKEDETSDNL